MNNRIVIALFIFFCKTSYSQNIEWNTYDFDSIVSVEMPFEVYELDTIEDNQKMYQIYSGNESSNFIAQKVYLGKVYSNVEAVTLPYNDASLEKCYSKIINVFIEGFQYLDDFKYNFESSKRIKKSDLKGQKIVFTNKKGLPVLEMDIFIVNKNIYSFTYRDTDGLREIERKKFLDSITFNNQIELKQYYEKPSLFNKKIILILLSLLLVSFLIRFKSKRKSN